MWRIARTVVAGIGLAVAAWAAEVAKVGDITIREPWARASLGNAPNSAAYMTLETIGAARDRLIGGSTPAAERVELHTHIMEGGVARMRPVAAIEVAPGAPTVLAPGGPHVMLSGLTRKLEAGTTVPLTLVFERAGAVTLEVPIEGVMARTGSGHGGSMDHGDDGAMDHGEHGSH